MTNETNQAQWIESDGVSNLPTVAGVYALRCKNGVGGNGVWYAFFDGLVFHGTTTESEDAARPCMIAFAETGDFRNGNVDAWRDYQGLMSKPAKVALKDRTAEDEEHAIFETWLDRERPSGDVEQVHYAWIQSGDYANLMDAREERNMRRADAVMASDEPGIAAARIPDPVVFCTFEVDGVKYDKALLAAFLDSQRPKPAPNTTPRGIMTVWNERADHRLGMWQGMQDA